MKIATKYEQNEPDYFLRKVAEDMAWYQSAI